MYNLPVNSQSPSSSENRLAAIERSLAEYCRELLNAPAVQMSDNFLDLGGDSLSAMIFMSRIYKDYQVQLTLEDFFLEPGTIGAIASAILEHLPQEQNAGTGDSAAAGA